MPGLESIERAHGLHESLVDHVVDIEATTQRLRNLTREQRAESLMHPPVELVLRRPNVFALPYLLNQFVNFHDLSV